MKSVNLILLVTIIMLFINCNNSSMNSDQTLVESQTKVETPKVEATKSELKNFTKEDVSRFAISTIMGQPSNKIKVRKEDELYYLTYKRVSDGKKFSYKIKFDGTTIIWANFDGRWRDGIYDERISFEETGNTLKISQTFSDGSVGMKEFKKDE